ncbi:hypothetical protein F3Y22_tig00110204pilonHSYRG00075 [Hibiscus syriacus]|uniref:Uncharacterized protein n=1 Tax=Hibiscus syriacus TaxID=106335 RepID=A0A6A3B9W5_HIBSY|nr:hypothetical protein F3Y22_tig00110204pilonHSYRG00075 [Hibiscus syriacus]
MANNSNNVAIIFGVTVLVGRELTKRLISKSKWKIYGVARNPEIIPIKSSSYHFISCDLLDPFETTQKLSMLQDATHVFWVTWASQHPLNTPECCEQNKEMMSSALNAVLPIAKGLKHFALQTGMSHYVPSNAKTIHLFDEEWLRPSGSSNFYYVLEDLLHERLGGKFVYGAICKHLSLPFVFGGTRECWEENYIDGSDARLIAEQKIWAATACEDVVCSDGEAFNAINGSSFTWKEIWPILGKKLGVRVPEEMFMEGFWFKSAMGDKKKEWEEVVVKEKLVETKMEEPIGNS